MVAGCRFSCDPAAPDPDCPDGPHARGTPDHGARPGWSNCRSARPRTGSSARSTWSGRWPTASRAYQPGLLAEAHRGVLYVDEVNLLHDHLVDAAARRRRHGPGARRARRACRSSHAARFLLVGTMNPEEGELRPQLLDRFGLDRRGAARRATSATRAEVVRRRLAFDDDPGRVRRRAGRPPSARRPRASPTRRPALGVGGAARRRAAAHRRGVRRVRRRRHARRPRHRPRRRRARRLAGRGAVAEEDVRVAARLALPHRRRRDPFDEPGVDEQARRRHGARPQEPRPTRTTPTAGRRNTRDGDARGPTGGRRDGGPEAAATTAECGPMSDAAGPPRRWRTADGPARDGGRPRRRRTAERRANGRHAGGTAGRWAERPDGARARRGGATGPGEPVGATRRPRRTARPDVPRSPPRRARRRRGRPRTAVAGPHRARPGRAGLRHARPAGRRRAPPGDRRRGRAPPARPRPRVPAPAASRRRARTPCARAGRATSCCSPSTRPGRWPRRRGWPPSRARCCRCCATPTSAATRSA